MNRTIPEIAEELRAHINTDNDAERLICEHVLPLVGIDVDSPEDFEDIEDLENKLADVKRNLRKDLDKHGDDIPEDALNDLKATLDSIIEP